MDSQLEKILSDVGAKFGAYVPNLVAGVVLVLAGWILGWVAKRVAIQFLSVIRIDRLFRQFKWGSAFARADVRHTFLIFTGNIMFVIVFMILIKKALEVLQLPILSEIIDRGILFFPRLFSGFVLVGLGWLLAGSIAAVVDRALTREEVPRASLIALIVKGVVILFSWAMALTVVDVATQIVVIGFATAIITIATIAIAFTFVASRSLFARKFDSHDA